jgi:acetyl esterase/lipase
MAEPSRGDNVERITNVSSPTITVYPAPGQGAPAPAAIICPGGGYGKLAINKEGSEIAAWLNSLGITAVVLKYRVPNNRAGALQDVQRAMRLVRGHCSEWNIDPHSVGIIGFSAGGHLAALLSAGQGDAAYESIDNSDALGLRPDFAVLVYPAYLADNDGRLAPEFKISSKIPPILIIHSEDDLKYVAGSKALHANLEAANVPHRLLLYPSGGHGYGLRCEKDAKAWPEAAKTWLTENMVIAPTLGGLPGASNAEK